MLRRGDGEAVESRRSSRWYLRYALPLLQNTAILHCPHIAIALIILDKRPMPFSLGMLTIHVPARPAAARLASHERRSDERANRPLALMTQSFVHRQIQNRTLHNEPIWLPCVDIESVLSNRIVHAGRVYGRIWKPLKH